MVEEVAALHRCTCGPSGLTSDIEEPLTVPNPARRPISTIYQAVRRVCVFYHSIFVCEHNYHRLEIYYQRAVSLERELFGHPQLGMFPISGYTALENIMDHFHEVRRRFLLQGLISPWDEAE